MRVSESVQNRSAAARRRCGCAVAGVLLATAGCGADVVPEREAVARTSETIVGGDPVAPGAWRSVLRLDDSCTGVAIDQDFFLMAQHCGVPNLAWVDAASSGGLADAIPVSGCDAFPGGGLESGTELSLCRLSRKLPELEFVPVALGCERAAVQPGNSALLVGYGTTSYAAADFGTKRAVMAPIGEVGSEIVIGDEATSGCRGDSGGPAFVQVEDASGTPRWRLAALFSSGYVGRCDVGFYLDLELLLPWIELKTQRDYSPCHDDQGTWAPTSDCREISLDNDGLPAGGTADAAGATTCGAAFDDSDADARPPKVNRVRVTWHEPSQQALVDVDATDSGWGVRSVHIEIVDAHQRTIAAEEDEIAPYAVLFSGVASEHAVRVTVSDRAANRTTVLRAVRESRSDGGCSWVGGERGSPWLAACFAWLCWSARRRFFATSRASVPPRVV